MRKIWTAALLAAVLVLCAGTAAAAEQEYVIYDVESVLCEVTGLSALSAEPEKAWPQGATSYRDLLGAKEQQAYDRIVAALDEYTADLRTLDAAAAEDYLAGADCPISLETINFLSGAKVCWIVPDVHTAVVEVDGWYEIRDNARYWYYDQERFKAEIQAEGDRFWDAIRAVTMDHPEYFWIRQYTSYDTAFVGNPVEVEGSGENTKENPSTYQITCVYDAVYITLPMSDTVAECAALQQRLTPVIDDLVAAVEGMTQAESVTYWDNWLAANNQYNENVAGLSVTVDETPWSVVGGLLDGYDPVCEGYAKAIQLLCHKIGVPCLAVDGIATNSGGSGGHMWNAVQLGGVWFFQDSTWNDPGMGSNSYTASTREYLLVKQPDSHVEDTAYFPVPVCGEDYFAYANSEIEELMTKPPEERYTWGRTESGISGFEIGSGEMVVALYDKHDRMLGMVECTVSLVNWYGYELTVYTVPEVDQALLNKAHRVVRFNFESNNYAPLFELREITGAGA